MSAYMFFAKDERVIVREQNPDMVFSEVGKTIAANWQKLTFEQKQKWEEMGAQERSRYQTELKEYESRQAIQPAQVINNT